jgi:transcriptional regulator with XRE-family HTH domain
MLVWRITHKEVGEDGMTSVLKALREKAGLSQHDLARKSKVDQGNISRVENGQATFTLESAENIAHALGADPMALTLTIGLDTIQTQAEAGKMRPDEVALKSAQLISLAASKPGLLTTEDVHRLADATAETMRVAKRAAQRSATKGREQTGESFDMYTALGRNADGTRPNRPKIEKLGHYRLDERDYGGAAGRNPQERHYGRTYGGAEVGPGPVVEGEPAPARKTGALEDVLDRGPGGLKRRKRFS